MGRNSPESLARQRSVTCNLCRQRKPDECEGSLCPHCAGYIAWRKREMPDCDANLSMSPAERQARERRILAYQVRASLGLPIFDQVREESVA